MSQTSRKVTAPVYRIGDSSALKAARDQLAFSLSEAVVSEVVSAKRKGAVVWGAAGIGILLLGVLFRAFDNGALGTIVIVATGCVAVGFSVMAGVRALSGPQQAESSEKLFNDFLDSALSVGAMGYVENAYALLAETARATSSCATLASFKAAWEKHVNDLNPPTVAKTTTYHVVAIDSQAVEGDRTLVAASCLIEIRIEEQAGNTTTTWPSEYRCYEMAGVERGGKWYAVAGTPEDEPAERRTFTVREQSA